MNPFLSIGMRCPCCQGYRHVVGWVGDLAFEELRVLVDELVEDARKGGVPLVAWPALGQAFEVFA